MLYAADNDLGLGPKVPSAEGKMLVFSIDHCTCAPLSRKLPLT